MSKYTMAFIHLIEGLPTVKNSNVSGLTIGVFDFFESSAEGLICANAAEQLKPRFVRVTGLRLIKPLDVINKEIEEGGGEFGKHFEICPIALAGAVMLSNSNLELPEALRLGKYRIQSSFRLIFEEIEDLEAA